MRAMKIFTIFLFLIVIPAFSSCENDQSGQGDNKQVYFNSFESQSDTSGWDGYAFSFNDDSPRHGGRQSLYISGGCIIPHASFILPPQPTDCYLGLKCWGKNLTSGGGVSLSVNKAGHGGIGIDVTEKVWTSYVSEDKLFCPANSSLTLQITSGGFASSSILVDMIEIRKVSN